MGAVGNCSDVNGGGRFEISMMILMPLVVAAFLIWYSKLAESKGWISQDQQIPH